MAGGGLTLLPLRQNAACIGSSGDWSCLGTHKACEWQTVSEPAEATPVQRQIFLQTLPPHPAVHPYLGGSIESPFGCQGMSMFCSLCPGMAGEL